jgi:hypothetical protein
MCLFLPIEAMQTHIYNFIGQHNTSIQTGSNLPPAPHNKTLITGSYGKRIKILMLFSLATYALIQARLWYSRYCINQYCPWSQYTFPQNIKALKQIYQTAEFLAALEKEKQLLNSYSNLVLLLKKLCLLRIFYYDQQVYESIEPRLARLLYLENCFQNQKYKNREGQAYV